MFTLTDQLPEKLDILAQKTFEELKENPQIIKEIRDIFLTRGGINTRNKNGDTYLHLLTSAAGLKEFMKAERAQNGSDSEYILDIPIVVSWFKPNPFVQNEQGFTPSFMAAFYQDTQAHAMLTSYENMYQNKHMAETLFAMSEMNILAQYHYSSSSGIYMTNRQDPEFFELRKKIKHNTSKFGVSFQLQRED